MPAGLASARFPSLVLLFVSAPLLVNSDFDVNLHVTRQIKGAAYPVNAAGAMCTPTSLAENSCECFGGAARRQTALRFARTSATDSNVALDMGAYFSGSGLFFPTFGGEASAKLFAQAGYSAFGLSWRDFSAVQNPTEKPGAALAAFIDTVRDDNPEIPAAVVTNMDLTGDETLRAADVFDRASRLADGHIAQYALVPLAGGKWMAVLCLLDPKYIEQSNPTYASRMRPFDSSLTGVRPPRAPPRLAPHSATCHPPIPLSPRRSRTCGAWTGVHRT